MMIDTIVIASVVIELFVETIGSCSQSDEVEMRWDLPFACCQCYLIFFVIAMSV